MPILLLALLSSFTFAETYSLEKGVGTYEVKHLIKRVEGENKNLKGKMVCESETCEFLVAGFVKDFVSSDSNRDLNMRTMADTSEFPQVSGKGSFPASELEKKEFKISMEVLFHGVTKKYETIIKKMNPFHFTASFVLLLEQHKIDRPSLFGVAINDEVPMTFDLKWQQNLNK